MGCKEIKTTKYFESTRIRADRNTIKIEWIVHVINNPVKKLIQEDGRIKLWGIIEEMNNRYLRVILLDDGETVHNAFFDRRFKL